MESGHLLHWALTCPSNGNTRYLKSRHSFVGYLPHNNSSYSSDENITSAALRADHRWNAERLESTTRFRTSIPDPPSRNDPPKNSVVPAQPPPHQCRTFPLLPTQMGHGHFSSLWVWCRRTNSWPYCFPMSNPSTSAWISRPETVDWLLNICPEIYCGQAVDGKNWLKRWWWSSFCLRTVDISN